MYKKIATWAGIALGFVFLNVVTWLGLNITRHLLQDHAIFDALVYKQTQQAPAPAKP